MILLVQCVIIFTFQQGQKSGVCSHIKAASQCFKDSESVVLKGSVLNSMPLHHSLKSEIWQLATTTPGRCL